MGDYIPEEIVEEIRQRFDLVEYISRFTPLKKTGNSFRGLCPFHGEKTPSFHVSPQKQLYHCFGCGAGGNLFSFVMAQDNLAFNEAVRSLAREAGISIPERPLGLGEKRLRDLRAELLRVNRLALDYYRQNLLSSKYGKGALNYLKKRGLKDAIIEKFHIGYSLPRWEALQSYLNGKNCRDEHIEKAGLIVARPGEKRGYYDRFRGRIMFPIFNLQDQVVGFGGRVIDDSQPKYLNSPETPLYHKGKNLFALNFSRGSIREKEQAVVFEGYLDVISAYQGGIENCVASLGTSLTGGQARLLRQNSREVVIAYDPDTAGQAAVLRGLDILGSAGCRVKVAQLPEGRDPDDYIREKGAGLFQEEILDPALPLVDYRLLVIQKEVCGGDPGNPEVKMRYLQGALPVLAGLENQVERDLYVQKVSNQLNVSPGSVLMELKKYKPGARGRKKEGTGPLQNPDGPPPAEKQLLSLMLSYPQCAVEIAGSLSIEDFSFTGYRPIIEKIYHQVQEKGNFAHQGLVNLFADHPQAQREIAGLVISGEQSLSTREKILKDCIKKIKVSRLEKRKKEIEREIAGLAGNNPQETRDLLAKWSELKRMEIEMG